MKLLKKRTSKVARQVITKLNEGVEPKKIIDAKCEEELSDKSTLSSFKQRTKTKEYQYDDIHEVYKTLAKDMDEDARKVIILYRNFEINKTFSEESDEFGCFLEAYVHQGEFRSTIASSYSPEELIRCIEKYRPRIIISKEKTEEIIRLGKECHYNGIIKGDVEQALIVMLHLTHIFKLRMDQQKKWYKKYEDRIKREVEQFKADHGIRDFMDENEWKQKHGELQYHLSIQELFLQTIYSFNGLYYNIDVCYKEYEEAFDNIFVDMPLGRDFDIAIIRFLLLSLYNSNHKTNYEISY